jgi:murein DD-endopeptidase MepM/ murein hydrolase activator NlpD
MIKRFRKVGLLILLFIISISSDIYSQFVSPILHTLKFSGTYGELRPNHFHNGVDLKIDRTLNTNYVVAVMEGIVRKINVAPDGYGNLLIVDHPNGFSSLYAHLDRFSADIQEIVRNYQKENQCFEVVLDSLNIPVSQGQIIGVIGNTGASNGPHLHYEIFNTATNHSYNPMLFGIKIIDTTSPVFQKLKIIGLDDEYNQLNSKTYTLKKVKNDSFALTEDTLYYGADQIGFDIMAYDIVSGTTNHNGIYKLSLKVDSIPVFSFTMNNLNQNLNSHFKAHIDQKEYLNTGKIYHRLFKLPGNELEIYDLTSENAKIRIDTSKLKLIEILIEDFDGNISKLKFHIKRDTATLKVNKPRFNYQIESGKKYEIPDPDFKLKIAENSFFKNTYLNLTKPDSSLYSAHIKININNEAFKNQVELYVKPLITDKYTDKLCIVKINGSKKKNIGGIMVDGHMFAKISEEGTFVLLADTIAPTLKALNFNINMKNKDRFIFSVSDNFSSGLTVPHLKATGFIDDQWVLFEYDKKYRSLVYKFDKTIKPGKHSLKLIVEDTRGNKTEFKKDFIR